MGVTEHRQDLFENIVRLRRAGRKASRDSDVATVRMELEQQLGPTVSRRLAARVLGVSHTALERWIRAGDVAVVYSPAGRLELPLDALLDLRESVEAERARRPRRYALAATIARQRDAARHLSIGDLETFGRDSGHDRARARSLVYHQVVARRLRRAMVDDAWYVLFRWRAQGRIDARYAGAWQKIFERPLPDIRRALVEQSVEADDLRQNSPFAGLLSEAERRQILLEVT